MAIVPSSDARFRTVEYGDLDQIMAIELEAYSEPWTRLMFEQELGHDRSFFYVLEQADDIMGYGGFWLVLDEAHITSVTVRDVFRGQKLGRQVLEYLLEEARDLGARLATLEVRESNKVARRLYETAGFEVISVRKGYYPKSGEDALVMLLEMRA